jgi:hypothetical protein
VLLARTQWSAKATTNNFYKRICTKFGDNVIKKLVPRAGTGQRKDDDKTNILRDSWEEILNGESGDSEAMEIFIEKCSLR